MTPDIDPEFENGNGKRAARNALDESRQSSARADKVIRETRQAIDAVRVARERNHFVDKFRVIIQGGHQ